MSDLNPTMSDNSAINSNESVNKPADTPMINMENVAPSKTQNDKGNKSKAQTFCI